MSSQRPIWFVICDKCGRRMCRDKRYRQHVPLGTEKNCLLTYKLQGAAQTAAYLKACPCEPGNSDTTHLIALYPEDEIDAAGNITRNTKIIRIFKLVTSGHTTKLPPSYFEDEDEFRKSIKRLKNLKFIVTGFELIDGKWRQIYVDD